MNNAYTFQINGLEISQPDSSGLWEVRDPKTDTVVAVELSKKDAAKAAREWSN